MDDRSALLPIRMLNEHLYCPRLFHLMHVQGVWAESADTVEGRAQHARGQARLPSRAVETASGDQWPAPPRDLSLSDPGLGITGRLDALEEPEGDAGWVPVEAKHSAPPPPDRAILASDGTALQPGAWNNDQIQVAAQMLLLRAAGYACDHALIHYRKTRQKVRVDLTPALESALLAEIAAARRTESSPMPPPLVDSPKCPRCSLAHVCLPDETNHLLQRATGSVPRVVPSRDDMGVLYVTEQGLRLGKESETVVVRNPDGETLASVPFKDVAHVVLSSAAQMSSQLLVALMESGRGVSWLSFGGRYVGSAQPPLAKNFHLRRAQYRLMDDEARCLSLSRSVVVAKLVNCRTLLRRNEGSPGTLRALRLRIHDARRGADRAALMGTEGMGAREYYPAFAALLRDPLGDTWEGRSRRPPRDPLNALLSFGYALLARDTETALRNAGLEPMASFYHAPENGRPSLALDLMEPFRPLIVDSTVLRAVNSRTVTQADFVVLPASASLKPAARKRFIAAYEQRMGETVRHPRFGYSISYRRILELEARLFARHLEGELPDYVPLMTR